MARKVDKPADATAEPSSAVVDAAVLKPDVYAQRRQDLEKKFVEG